MKGKTLRLNQKWFVTKMKLTAQDKQIQKLVSKVQELERYRMESDKIQKLIIKRMQGRMAERKISWFKTLFGYGRLFLMNFPTIYYWYSTIPIANFLLLILTNYKTQIPYKEPSVMLQEVGQVLRII